MSEVTTLSVADGKIKQGTLLDYLILKFGAFDISKVEIKKDGNVLMDFEFSDEISCLEADQIVITSNSVINATEAQWVVNNHKEVCKDKIPPMLEGLLAVLAPTLGMSKEQLRQACIDNLPSS